MSKSPLEYLRRGLQTPPKQVVRWAVRRFRAETDHRVSPRISRDLTPDSLLRRLDAPDLAILWEDLAALPYATVIERPALDDDDVKYVLEAAEAAMNREVDLMGAGPTRLPNPVDWHTDFKSGHTWPRDPFCRLRVVEPANAADVKVPWELSRLQWLIPLGQAYLLTGEDRYATVTREIIAEWIAGNPLGIGINWACAMEPAMRIVVLTWLFHVFHASQAWSGEDFRFVFLKSVFEHGIFVARHLEWADVNGNHLLADATGLVFAGTFFGRGREPKTWAETGWRILTSELPRQVHGDGVGFEASAAYHRFVLELLVFAAHYRLRRNEVLEPSVRNRLAAMARFIAATAGPDGRAPLWGDSDDGRVLPMDGRPLNDHRYLVRLTGLVLGDDELVGTVADPSAESTWILGVPRSTAAPGTFPPSSGFEQGGAYVMRSSADRVFIDCGPVGMNGRGGHGHNDCLAVDAVLGGIPVLVDCGSFVYGASVEWRNRFRSTTAHNTPMIDGAEQNRLIRPDYLWTLRADAVPDIRRWHTTETKDIFIGAHSGYRRLDDPAVPVRGVLLDKRNHRLIVTDRVEAAGSHHVSIPYHLAPGMTARPVDDRHWQLEGGFLFVWEGDEFWSCEARKGWYSPSYGVKQPITVIEFQRSGPAASLRVAFLPAIGAPTDTVDWLRSTCRDWIE